MVQIAAGTPEHLVKELMLPQFKRLCQDSETDVRVRVAAGFHEFAKCLGDDAALLIDSFVDLVYSGDPEVISSLTAHLAETLECIYGAGRATCTVDSNGNVVQQVRRSIQLLGGHPKTMTSFQNSTSFTQLTRILLACNRLIRNGSNWRCHEQLLAAFACLSQFITNDELCQSFVPMMKEEVVNAVMILPPWPADPSLSISFLSESRALSYCCFTYIGQMDARSETERGCAICSYLLYSK